VHPHPYLASEHPIAFAHRGGALEAPENTMKAFKHAAEVGFRYIETDAQLTADGVAIAFHDERIDRVTNRTGAISEMTWDELSELVVHPEIDGGGRLVSIEELLREFPKHHFNIDAKTSEVLDPLLDVLAAAGALDRVCVASFFDHRLSTARKRLGDMVCTAQGPFESLTSLVQGALGRSPEYAVSRPFQIPVKVGPVRVANTRIVQLAHDFGSPVHIWTIDDAKTMHQLLDIGVDGIMTDRPTVLRDVLLERGQWPSGAN